MPHNGLLFVIEYLFFMIMLPSLLDLIADCCSGYYKVKKTNICNEQLENIYLGTQAAIVIGIVIIFLIVFPPVVFYVPEYLSGELFPRAQKNYNILVMLVMIVLHIYFIVRMLLVLKEQVKIGKNFKVHIHKGRCIAWIFALEFVNGLSSIIMVAAMFGNFNIVIKVIWIFLTVMFWVLMLCLFWEDHYFLKVSSKSIFYCDRKMKYSNEKEKVLEIKRTGKHIDIILENDIVLPVYDIESNTE